MTSLLIFNKTSNNSSDKSPDISSMGFTLISVLLIILAMGAFSTALFVSIAPSIKAGQVSLTYQRADVLQAAIKVYKMHNPSAPLTLGALVTPTATPCSVDINTASATYRKLRGWCGPYVDQTIAAVSDFQIDGWGTIFQYNQVTIVSCGPNFVCGDGDDIIFNNF